MQSKLASKEPIEYRGSERHIISLDIEVYEGYCRAYPLSKTFRKFTGSNIPTSLNFRLNRIDEKRVIALAEARDSNVSLAANDFCNRNDNNQCQIDVCDVFHINSLTFIWSLLSQSGRPAPLKYRKEMERLERFVKWYWKEESGIVQQHDQNQILKCTSFIAYSDSVSQQIEHAFQKFKRDTKNCNLSIRIRRHSSSKNFLQRTRNALIGTQYNIDFLNMVQINSSSFNKRKIIRKQCYSQTLPKNSSTYNQVATYFQASLGDTKVSFIIVSIDIVLNKALWQLYCVYLNNLQAKETQKAKFYELTNNCERRWLFHGTKSEKVLGIMQNGFNRSYGEGSTYGKGSYRYFARDATLACSTCYATPDTSGNQHVFLCRVAVGQWCHGRWGQTIPDTKLYDPCEFYDTTVDNVENPRIFVAYHDAQVYPEYLITFRKNYR